MERLGDALSRAIADARSASEVMYDEAAEARDRARDARAARASLLDEAAPKITAEDIKRLVQGAEEPTHATRIVKAWWSRLASGDPAFGARVLVLLGGTGCGKSVAACWALSRERGRFVTVERLLMIARSRSPLHLAEHDAVMRAKVLVLDEAGAEQNQEASRAIVLDLLNSRQRGELTIITSNLDDLAFRSWLDERALSRVMQIGRIVRVIGPDMRQQSAA